MVVAAGRGIGRSTTTMNDILIIDDDPQVRLAFGATLRSRGMSVREAEDAEGGAAEIRRKLPDLVLCDVHLPGKDGFELLSALRVERATASLPCILITGEGEAEVQRHGMELGADDFLRKPCTDQTLLAAVAARLARHEQTRREATELESRLAAILEASADIVMVTDPSARTIQYANRTAIESLRMEHPLPPGGLPLVRVMPPAATEHFRLHSVREAERRGICVEESVFMTCGGQEIQVSRQLLAERDAAGGVRHFAIIARDLTAQRESEDRLRRMSRALEQCPVSIVMTDTHGAIEYVNPKFTQVTGYTAEEVMGRNPRVLKSGETTDTEYRRLWQTIASGGEWRGEFQNRRKHGELFWEQASISGIVDETGKVTHFVAVKEDITERKLAQQQHAILESQLHQAQKLESIGRLSAGIAHEINTPMQYVGDNVRFFRTAFEQLATVLECHARLVQTLKENHRMSGDLDEILEPAAPVNVAFLLHEVPACVDDAAEGVARVQKILRAMKDFSHPGTEEKTEVDLNRLIESTITVSRNEWKYVAEVVPDLDPDLPPVPCLPGEFNQVILNLLVNAAHAIGDVVQAGGEERGRITVRTRAGDGWVEIRITDTGTGIPEHVRGHVFEPFFTTKEVGKGTGQGLMLARSIVVERHGGTIDFETRTGQGTTFIVRLPLGPAGTTKAGQAA